MTRLLRRISGSKEKSAVRIFLFYIKELFGLARGKIILNLCLMVVLGALEGIGILLLIPLLHFAGIGKMPWTATGSGFAIADAFRSMAPAFSLPVVLLVYVGLILLQSGLQRYQSNLNARIQQSLHSYLSVRIFKGLADAKWSFLAAWKKSDMKAIFTSELARISAGTHFLFQLTVTVILAVIQIMIALMLSPTLTLVVVGGGLIFFVITQAHVRRVKELGSALSKHNRDLTFAITEHLNGIKEVKSCGMEDMHIARFKEIREAIENNFVRFNRVQSGTRMLYRVGAAIFISVFFYGMVNFFHTRPQEILVIIVIFARLWPRFSAAQGGLQHVAMMLPAYFDVMEFERQCLKEKEVYVDKRHYDPVGLKERIEFKDVSFSYGPKSNGYAVKDLSFTVPAGSITALVGVSGSGKSTVADLITGMLSPQKGQVLVDGVSLDSVNVHSWRKMIGYVPQDAFLFNASIRENLLWAYPEAKTGDILQALRLAAVDDFVAALPEGIDTVVGDRGLRLSGGERQRIVLARALLKKPSLLILDEATSALDRENENRILKAIEGLRGKLTIVLISHRFSTIRQADRIIVMDNGTAVEIGDYQSLASKANGRFSALMSV
jgi:ATP-binding cassette subfamily C protein